MWVQLIVRGRSAPCVVCVFAPSLPLSRLSRHHVRRDAREKWNLAERRAGFQRHDAVANPIESMADSAGFLSNEERFHTDVAGELKTANDVCAPSDRIPDPTPCPRSQEPARARR